MLVNSKKMLLAAQEGGYAVAAFNVENMEMVKAVIKTAVENKAPVIIQTTPSTVRYASLKMFYAMVKAEAEKVCVPVALHLDHGSSFDLAVQGIKEGYTSIMIDGSHESFEDNIAVSKAVVAVARPNNIAVEAELGKVGGKEDDLEVEVDTNTDPQEAKEFVERTGVDSLAVAIGTAHGFYVGDPKLDKARLDEIKKLVSIPLVLHGASGVSDADVADCIRRGICKVNFATDLRVAYTDGVKELLKVAPDTFDPKKFGEAGMKKVSDLVKAKMEVCGCVGKAQNSKCCKQFSCNVKGERTLDKYLMGMDIGTSSCKVAIFDTKGEVVAQTNGEYHTYYPQEGFVEQNPEEWWNAVCEASKLCIQKANINPEQIAGVGVAGQSWSAIAVDVDGNVLVNNPIWMDTRSSDICKILTNQLGPQRIFELSGNSLQPTYTTGKIIYYKLHHPAVYERIFAILQSNSYIVYKLTGEFSQDKSQGYGIHCYDMKEGTWDQDMCAQLGIKASILPKIYECSDIVGSINKTAAEKSGLLEGTKVVAGGLDAACATLGVGVIHNGQTQEQGGQAGGMSICIDTYKADSRLILSNHVVPGKWLLQGGTTGGGGVMRWVERELGDRGTAKERGLSSFDYLNEIAAAVPAGSDGVTFLPYMAGERSPIWNPYAKGVYYGLDFSKTRGHMVRSSMEGVAYSLKHNLDIAKDAGASVKELVATGGSANSLLWTQIKSDVTGKDIIVPASDEATPLGAAILAGVGVGIYDSFEDAVRRCVTIKRMHTANKDNQLTYGQGYKKYLKLYDLLEDMMQPQEN